MDRIEAMRLFASIVELGSFTRAARRQGVSAAAASRALAALEARLQTSLLVRTSRVVRPTEQGAAFARTCRQLLAAIDEAEEQARGTAHAMRGHLTITAPQVFGRLHLAPIVLAFLARHPAVTVRLALQDRIVPLIEEGIDVALRIGHLPDSSLIARQVGMVRRIVVAAPSYLADHAPPRIPADLARHAIVAFTGGDAETRWAFPDAEVALAPRLIVDSAEVAVAAAVAGFGITRVLSYQAKAAVADGRLVVLLADHEPAPLPVHLVHPEQRLQAARIRAFLDFAAMTLPDALHA